VNTMEKKQFVKVLPNNEIELHGADETYQCPISEIAEMEICFDDGMGFGWIDGDCKKVPSKPQRWILIVMIGRNPERKRILFIASSEMDAEGYRLMINQIRHASFTLSVSPPSESWFARVLRSIKAKVH